MACSRIVVAFLALSMAFCRPLRAGGNEEMREVELTRREAIVAITRGDHARSLALFSKALQLLEKTKLEGHEVDSWNVRLQLAQVLGALGQPMDALHEFRRALAASPGASHADSHGLVAAGDRPRPLFRLSCHQHTLVVRLTPNIMLFCVGSLCGSSDCSSGGGRGPRECSSTCRRDISATALARADAKRGRMFSAQDLVACVRLLLDALSACSVRGERRGSGHAR